MGDEAVSPQAGLAVLDDVRHISDLLHARSINSHDSGLCSEFTKFLNDPGNRKIFLGEFAFRLRALSHDSIRRPPRTNRLRDDKSEKKILGEFLDFVFQVFYHPTINRINYASGKLPKGKGKSKKVNGRYPADQEYLYLKDLQTCISRQIDVLSWDRSNKDDPYYNHRRVLKLLCDECSIVDYYHALSSIEVGTLTESLRASVEERKRQMEEFFFEDGSRHEESFNNKIKEWGICVIRLTAFQTVDLFGESRLDNLQECTPLDCLVIVERVHKDKKEWVIPIAKMVLPWGVPSVSRPS